MESAFKHKAVLIFIGISSIVVAILGALYNGWMLYIDLPGNTNDIDAEINEEYFVMSFYIMTYICLIFFTFLFLSGIQLIRQKLVWVYVLVTVITLEIIYWLILGSMWLHPKYGYSIAAATGVSNGGLTFQIFSLYIIWAPLLALYVKFKSSNKRLWRQPQKK